MKKRSNQGFGPSIERDKFDVFQCTIKSTLHENFLNGSPIENSISGMHLLVIYIMILIPKQTWVVRDFCLSQNKKS